MNLAEYHAKVLSKHERLWEVAHMLPALFQTIRYCQECQIVLPEWAARGAMQVVQDQFHDMVPGKRGGKGSAKAKFQMDYAHYLRWNAVTGQKWLNFDASPNKRGAPKKGATRKDEMLSEAKRILKKSTQNRLVWNCRDAQLLKSYRDVENSRQAGELRFAFDQLFYPLE